jgi:hypothetical protein
MIAGLRSKFFLAFAREVDGVVADANIGRRLLCEVGRGLQFRRSCGRR